MRFCAKATLHLTALVLTAAPIWPEPNAIDTDIAGLAHECNRLRWEEGWGASGKNACTKLANLAEHDKDPTVRSQAIGFRRTWPCWRRSCCTKRMTMSARLRPTGLSPFLLSTVIGLASKTVGWMLALSWRTLRSTTKTQRCAAKLSAS